MAYKVPTFDEFRGFLVAFWKGTFPLSNVGSRFSYHWKRLTVYAGGGTDLHAHIDSAQRDVMPDTSQGAFLTRWGGIVGVAKKTATPARKSKSLQVYGIVGAAVVIGDQLQHPPTGLRFQVTENLAIAVAPSMLVDIEAIDVGSQTRLSAGETLVFTAPGAGIQANAKLVLDLDEDGFDEEQDPAYSVRVTDELGMPRAGGTQSDFEKWALEVVGVSLAKAYPNRAGVGTLDVAALHAGGGSARALTADERAAVLAHIETVAPAQVAATNGSLRVLETLPDPQNVVIAVTPNGDLAYEWDWNDGAGPLVVAAYTAGTREVQATAPLGGDMIAGGRVCFGAVASVQDGDVFTIEQITAADKFTLRETPSVVPVATDTVYAGGPLTKPIRDAIVAHMNGEIVYGAAGTPIPESVAGSTVGLNILAEGIGPANPAGFYGTWSGGLVRAVLMKIAAYPTGARNVNVITPAADYDEADIAFPNDDATNYITPRAVLIRRAW